MRLKSTTLANGTRYAALHFSADYGKDQAWERRKTSGEQLADGSWVAGVPIREWKEQMGMHEDIYDGVPVFADYSDTRHCPLSIREIGIPIFPGACYIGGWDGGLVPAFVLGQITTDFQVQRILEVTSEGDDPIETFVPRVLRACEKRIPGRWDEIYHTGDPTIWNRTPGTGESAGQLAKRKFGVNIRLSTNVWDVRRSAVTWSLTDRLDNGAPRSIIDPVHCPVLRKAYQGAYELEVSTRGDTVGAGRILSEPLKNGFSHCADADQYLQIAARRFCDGKLRLR